jgi:CheY-like chemotaxis protein
MTEKFKPPSPDENKNIVPYNSSIVRRGLELIAPIESSVVLQPNSLITQKSHKVLSVNCSGLRSHFMLETIIPWLPIATLMEASSGPEAWLEINADPPDLVLTCRKLPGFSGVHLAGAIQKLKLPCQVVIASTEYAPVLKMREAFVAGARDYLRLPISDEELINAVRRPLGLPAVQNVQKKHIDPNNDDILIKPLEKLLTPKLRNEFDLSVTQNNQEIALHLYYFDDIGGYKQMSETDPLFYYGSLYTPLIPVLVSSACELILPKISSFPPGFRLRLKWTMMTPSFLNMIGFSWLLSDMYLNEADFLTGRLDMIMELAQRNHLKGPLI